MTATTGVATTGTAPTVTVSLDEAGKGNPHANQTVSWSASDADGDPDSADLEVTDEGGVVVYDSTATSDTVSLEVKFGGEQTYIATVTARDASGLETVEKAGKFAV